jgi:hypothetical protein
MQRTKANDDVAGYPEHETGVYSWQAVHLTKKLHEEYLKEGADFKQLVENYYK